ncbi:MAG: S8 family serine peptidase [Deltaproteobacteria bacterium]|nr:S8 family serine peptidase [Deltaproteobacteria bacterium]MBI3293898.1 S8 family serine peptidase [Deltaproteobacteria bacterium]
MGQGGRAALKLGLVMLLGAACGWSKPFVDPALRLRLRANAIEPISAVIHLSGQYDLSQLKDSNHPQMEPNAHLIQALVRFNVEKSQTVTDFLKAQPSETVQEMRPLWITNSLRVKAAPSVIEKITKMESPESIYLNSGKEVDGDEGGATESTLSEAEQNVSWGIKKLRADAVWSLGFRGQGVVVALIDSGAALSHPDLAPNIWANLGESGFDENGQDKAINGKDDDGNGFIDDAHGWNFEDGNRDVTDVSGHGSQTAGIVGGMGAGGRVTGVAPKATLMILKACCNAGSTEMFESNVWEAYQYVIQKGVRLISMSLSAKHNSGPSYSKWRRASEVLLKAGVIHINSAGNRGGGNVPFNVGAPANNPPPWLHPLQPLNGGLTSMITIGATDENDTARFYSSSGPVTWEEVSEYKDYEYSSGAKLGLVKPDLCAPSEVPSTSMDGKSYTHSFGGTSSATPHIGGVMALLLSAQPSLTPAEAAEALQNTAAPVEGGFSNRCGAGRVDALAALEYVLKKNCKI